MMLLFGLSIKSLICLSIALLFAFTIHEFSHGLVAYWLGDDTAKRAGRLSLNPVVHLDPLGTLMILLVGFGWGKPVPVNPHLLRNGVRNGMAVVSAAGPAANLMAAGLLALPIRAGLLAWHSPLHYPSLAQWQLSWLAADIIGYIILINIILAIFNLIPIPPLDGFKVALRILPRDLSYSLLRLERYGPVVLLLIIFFDRFADTGILGRIIVPGTNFLSLLLVGRLSL